jgi:hypothetical protein
MHRHNPNGAGASEIYRQNRQEKRRKLGAAARIFLVVFASYEYHKSVPV